MKWYLASRTRHQTTLRALADKLTEVGEEVLSEWLYVEKFNSFENNPEVTAFSERIVEQVLEADIFVLISDSEGTDMFVELGIALSNSKANKIYIVGEDSKRSLMQLHPAVFHVQDIQEVLENEDILLNDLELDF